MDCNHFRFYTSNICLSTIRIPESPTYLMKRVVRKRLRTSYGTLEVFVILSRKNWGNRKIILESKHRTCHKGIIFPWTKESIHDFHRCTYIPGILWNENICFYPDCLCIQRWVKNAYTIKLCCWFHLRPITL